MSGLVRSESSVTDDRKLKEYDLRHSEALMAEVQRLTPVGSWVVRLPDIPEYWSPASFEIFGIDPAAGPPRNLTEFMSHVHPDDREVLLRAALGNASEGRVIDCTFRIVRPNGEIRVLREVGTPLHGNPSRYLGAWMDITEQERWIEELRRSEFYLEEGQRLAHMGSWAFNPSGFYDFWSQELFRIYGFDPAKGAPTLTEYLGVVHPQDREFMARTIERMLAESLGCDLKKRIVRPDGEVRYVRCVGVPVVDNGILKSIVGTAIDITEQEQLTLKLQRREAYLAEAQRLSHTGSFGWRVSTGEILWSEETFRIFEYGRTSKPTIDLILQRVHPEDAALVKQTIERASQDAKDFDFEHRLLMPDGSVKYGHVVARSFTDEPGDIEFVGAIMDVTAAKKAEERIRQDERELRQIVEAIPVLILILAPDGSPLYANERVLEYTGLTREDLQAGDFRKLVFHPSDVDRLRDKLRQALARGVPFELEKRARRKDGQYRWFIIRYEPLLDDQGHVIRWYGTGTDIDERKRAEERVRNENIALREEIDKASIFEEIVGTSAPLRSVLSYVARVAPTDATVLITGETGTGKELIARAIHKRSKRSARIFVSVNCAAIPAALVASELFGHEKGAFTGALQRRTGRFELAEGGTIFLDEIGELPPETQIALLRVLQEREFERVGGGRPIRTDVRVVAATNRNLEEAVAAGAFRTDLFYRLNVVPVAMPPLRERREDIPLLVEYFADRYARQTGKRIKRVSQKSLALLQSYAWPGNIRELQNVVERSVILAETDTLTVDARWLLIAGAIPAPGKQPFAAQRSAQQKATIEAALTETQGRVSGPSGAAARLQMPSSTLESKIRALGIDKRRFRRAWPAETSRTSSL